MNSMNTPPKSKCPFCGEETLPFEIRGELAEKCGTIYWDDFYAYECQTCEGEWEINVETGRKEIKQFPGVKLLKRLEKSKGTVFWPYKYNPGFPYEQNTSWLDYAIRKKEEPTMKVSYNGFAGELAKLEARGLCYDENKNPFQGYTLEIRDCEKKAIISFDLVKLEDVKFLGGAVSFGG